MKQSTEAKKRLLEARLEADAILATGANRLLLIEAILIVCVFVALFISLESATALLLSVLSESEALTSLLSQAVSSVFFVLGIFFVAPVVLGLFRLAEQMQAGETPVLMDLFYFLSSRKRYVQGLRATWLGSLKLMGTILVAIGVDKLFDSLALEGAMWNWLSGVLVAAIICLGVLLLLFPYTRLYAGLRPDEIDSRADIFSAAPRGGIRLVWFFFPWLLLGLVSIGLLLVLDVFPRMLLTYFCDCKRQDLNIF